jgi:hypothetical protein
MKQDTSSSFSNTQETTPQYDPAAWGARNAILEQYKQRLSGRGGFLTGYTGQGMRQINRSADLNKVALQNILSSRGLSSSPAGAAFEARGEDERMKQLTEFLGGIPLLDRQMEGEDLSNYGSFVSSLPTGMRTSSSGTGTGQQQSYGSTGAALGAGIGDAVSAAMLAKYLGKG